MRISRWMLIGLATALVSLSLATGVLAADEGDQDLEQVVQQLQAENPGLTKDEALEIAGLAAADAQGPPAREGAAGPATEGNAALGAPADLGLSFGQSGTLTPQEQKLMKEVSTFQQDLAQKGLGSEQIHNQIEAKFGEQLRQEGIEQGVFTPGERGGFEYGGPAAAGLERGMFESGREFGQSVAERARTMEHGSFSEGIGREGAQGMERGGSSEGIGREGAGGTSREQAEKSYQPMERDSNAQGREHGQRETEHRGGGSEREQPSVERPTYDREQPSVERPTYDREQPSVERPTYDREQPSVERPTYEMERPTSEQPEHPAYEVLN